jgi:APA family basic amino acid/polyamine antiporter
VPFVWPVTLVGALACIYTMIGLPYRAWERFGIWLLVGLSIYVFYSYRHSRLRS